MTSSRPGRFRLIAIALAAAVLLGYGAFWWIAAERFQAAALAWIDARRAEGYRVGYAALERDGFPLRLRLTFRDPGLAASGGGRWAWSGSRLMAEIAPWAPLRVTLRADGAQRVVLPGSGGPLVYTGTAGHVSASITADRSLPLRAVAIRDLRLAGREGADALAAGRLDLTLRRGDTAAGSGGDGNDKYDLSLVASDLRLPGRWRLPLGERVETLALDATVIGDPLARPWPGGVLAWRDAGGVVRVSGLHLRYGPLRLTGAGTLALDAGGQPAGTFSARGEGLADTLDALERRGLMKGVGVAGARLAVQILSRPSDTGEPGVTVPLALRDGVLFAASLPVLTLPPLVWPPPGPSDPRR